jgi:diguanylate cyclase (GGDEF)-like protein
MAEVNLPNEILNAGSVNVSDVLQYRRAQMRNRLGVWLLLMTACLPLIGWARTLAYASIYIILQAGESALYRRSIAFQNAGPGRAVSLGILACSVTTFMSPALIALFKMGSWGEICAVYLLASTALGSTVSAIGCRDAFIALFAPCVVYLAVLPVVAVLINGMPPMLFLIIVLLGSFYFIFYSAQIWRGSTKAKQAELQAVRSYIAQRDAHEAKLLKLTQRDSLTGLYNRDVLRARLGELTEARLPACLLIVDLDGFKFVNDTLGHSAGDEVLRIVASRLLRAARELDTVSRIGGDEFALLLTHTADPMAAIAVADRLLMEITQPVQFDALPINIGASIGIAISPLHGTDAGQLFAYADLALYQAKAEGRHCARLFHAGLRAVAEGKVLRDTELHQALEHGEFELYYQPQIRLADGGLAGAEALLRWRHPSQGLLSPEHFLPALEIGRLSARVGAWVIETACAQAALWRVSLDPDFRMGVNLFGSQFRAGNLVEWVQAALTKTGLPPGALEIEITENIILRHEDDMIQPLRQLRELGVGIAFDDYGTGFASLSMLTRYPVSRLKIDRAFTMAICESRADAAVVRYIIGLGATLGIAITAEGIETLEQAAALLQDGCNEGQGFYFGKPMTATQFEAYAAKLFKQVDRKVWTHSASYPAAE